MTESDSKPAVVLVSGGLDSATTLAIAKADGFNCHPITFDYGQRHAIELQAAKAGCGQLGVREPLTIKIDLRAVGGSALTDSIAVPKDRDEIAMNADIPVTYVPARNTIFLSIALGLAETLSASDLFVGINAVDYSGYPDCRPEFVSAFEALANVATKTGVEGTKFKVHAPLIELTKSEIIERGTELGVDYSLTHSCYDPVEDKACGHCDSCILRAEGFKSAKLSDPTHYLK
ncbi:MAG: 7-cyano-7-deazaguanine synthase QueC [Planctomycetes bacterium]|nr:7-cyano-7-deazaguanine synthase QueC [Planctomycetota bacterium]